MQVYYWRSIGNDLERTSKRPDTAWEQVELEGICDRDRAAATVFTRLVKAAGAGPAAFRVGVLSDLSRHMGQFRQGLVELSRREAGDRVDITWARGLWDQLHVLYRTRDDVFAARFARDLVKRGEALKGDDKSMLDMRLAGSRSPRHEPLYVFALVRQARTMEEVARITGSEIAELDQESAS